MPPARPQTKLYTKPTKPRRAHIGLDEFSKNDQMDSRQVLSRFFVIWTSNFSLAHLGGKVNHFEPFSEFVLGCNNVIKNGLSVLCNQHLIVIVVAIERPLTYEHTNSIFLNVVVSVGKSGADKNRRTSEQSSWSDNGHIM